MPSCRVKAAITLAFYEHATFWSSISSRGPLTNMGIGAFRYGAILELKEGSIEPWTVTLHTPYMW